LGPPALLVLLVALAALWAAGAARAAAPADEVALARTYAPVMRFKEQAEPCGPGEAYRPIDVELILGNPEVALMGPWNTTFVARQAPTGRYLSQGLPGFALDYPGDALDPGCTYEEFSRRTQGARPDTVYAHVATEAGRPGRLALQYWFFYLFNDYNNTHEGDWEMIQLVFEADTPAQALARGPTEVGYSQHEGAERAAWGDPKLEIVDGTRPVVYPAAGSHANYFGSALYLGRSGSQGLGCDDTTGPSVTGRQEIATVPAARPAYLAGYPWLGYDGHWGERQTAFYNGPTGPNTKDQWTRPITWSETDWRDASFAVPAGGVAGTSATGFFCGAVAGGSNVLRWATLHPAPVLLGLLAIVLVLLVAARRTAWRPSAPLRLARRRAVGQVLSASWRMYRGHPRLFLGIGLLFIPMGILISVIQYLLVQVGTLAPLVDSAGESNGIVVMLALGLGAVLSLGAYALVIAATARGMLELDAGREIRAPQAYRESLDSMRTLLVALAFTVAVQAVLALSLVLLPVALFLLVRWSLLAPVAEIEEHGIRGVLRRSGALVGGHLLKVLVLVIGLSSAALLVGPVAGALAILATGAAFNVVNLLAGLVYVLVMPYAAIATVYVYFDLRVRAGTEPARTPAPALLPAELELPGPAARP
jgi:hypothetical protein